ncbi:hypothetical protein THRCLA_12027, partial [Thraustotheca clavata]
MPINPRQRQGAYAILLCGVTIVLCLQIFSGISFISSWKRKNALRWQNGQSHNKLNDHILHLNNLNEICFHEKDSIIPWTYNSSTVDKKYVWLQEEKPSIELLQYLAQCHEVDVFLPLGIRNHGYCEDGMAYVKFLKARALPMWVLQMQFQYQGRENMTYFKLCPNSAMLFMNHYHDGVLNRTDFPAEKPVIIMPNVEMYELTADLYRRANYILCKTLDAFLDNGNPQSTTVLYAKHTSSDPSTMARAYAKLHKDFPPIQPKDFSKLTFFHANGHSSQKNTHAVLDCWAERPDLPLLDLYTMGEDTLDRYTYYKEENRSLENINFHYGEDVDAPYFGKLLAEAPVILCPSRMEGFGHYINQARAAGALVITTNGPPMNEFVDSNSGVLVEADYGAPDPNQMLSIYGTMEFNVKGEYLCNAVDTILGMSIEERKRLAHNARKKYEEQMLDFMENMHLLQKALRISLRQRHYYYAILFCAAISLLGMMQFWLRMKKRPIVPQNLISKSLLKKHLTLQDHIIHLNNLNEICFHEKDAVIPWSYNSTIVDSRFVWKQTKTPSKLLIDLLAQCPEIDVYLPWSLRNHGYCEDAM